MQLKSALDGCKYIAKDKSGFIGCYQEKPSIVKDSEWQVKERKANPIVPLTGGSGNRLYGWVKLPKKYTELPWRESLYEILSDGSLQRACMTSLEALSLIREALGGLEGDVLHAFNVIDDNLREEQ